MAALSPAVRAALEVLERAQHEFTALGESWEGYRVDVELIAILLFAIGIQEVDDLRVGERQYAAFLDGDAPLIAVEARHHAHRKRFSIAHEIGHFVMHYQPDLRLFTCSSSDMEVGAEASGSRQLHMKREYEANLFAGELLMPEQPLRAMHRVTGGKLLPLARHFDVSPQAMAIRLERLHLPVRR